MVRIRKFESNIVLVIIGNDSWYRCIIENTEMYRPNKIAWVGFNVVKCINDIMVEAK